MSNKAVKEKIQSTRLFSDAEKIALLVRWDELLEEEIQKLEKVIDVYDQRYSQLVAGLKHEVEESLGSLGPNDSQELEDAQTLIRAGLGTLSS